MGLLRHKTEEERKELIFQVKPFAFDDQFIVEQFSINSGTSTVVNYMTTFAPSSGFDYHGIVTTTGGGYALASVGQKPTEPAQYSRAVLRRLERLAATPLDDTAPEGEREFMDWLHSD
jgi:hypothetical protein